MRGADKFQSSSFLLGHLDERRGLWLKILVRTGINQLSCAPSSLLRPPPSLPRSKPT